MMSRISTRSRSHLRAVLAYLVAILALTFLLFSVSLMSLVRQQSQMHELSAINLRAGGESLAYHLEQRIEELARECLSDPQVEILLLNPAVAGTPEEAAGLRRALTDLRKPYPFILHYFIMRGGEVLFPRLARWSPAANDGLPAGLSGSQVSVTFQTLLKRSETESARGRLAGALDLLRRAEILPVPDSHRAWVLARKMRLLLESNQPAQAGETCQQLASRYGDMYDASGVPYALYPVNLPPGIERQVYPDYPQRLSSLYRDVTRGRWEMSAEQVDFYLTEMEKKLARSHDLRPANEFLDQFDLARALGIANGFQQSFAPGQVFAQALRHDGSGYQTFSVQRSDRAGRLVVFGFAIDPSWVENEARRQAESAEESLLQASITLTSALGDPEAPQSGDILRVPFKTMLPFWALSISLSTVQAGAAAAHREVLFLGLSAMMFLSIMGLGVYLLTRVTRDLHYLELRNDFVNRVSHEFKTPLSLIRLYSETLAGGDADFTEEERRNYMQIIARESQRLGRMINNVLDYAGAERGHQTQDLKAGDLSVQVLQTVGDYSSLLSQQGFTLETEVEPGLPHVRFDRAQVAQVVVNLLDNARKYSGSSRAIHLKMWSLNQEVVLEVEDYGIGIPQEEQSKIFEPFYQIPDGRNKSGSGLGLYLVRHVMDGLGGRIEVRSEAGRGTKFRLYFPALEGDGAGARQPEKYEPLRAGIRD